MKSIKNKMITPQQLKAIQAGFSRMGMCADDRHDYIGNFTHGRTRSTKELTCEEARILIDAIYGVAKRTDFEQARKLVSSIYKLSFEISFLNKAYKDCHTEEDFQMNKAKINAFCRHKTSFHKNLTEMSLQELEAVKRQFEKLARKENEKK